MKIKSSRRKWIENSICSNGATVETMISSRALFSSMAGLFSLALGIFALVQAPKRRLNRLFALHSLMTVPVMMPAPDLWTSLFGHGVALVIFRIAQIGHPLGVFFFLCFLQELAGVYDKRVSRSLRRVGMTAILILSPFYATPLIVRDFTFVTRGSDQAFVRIPGPFFYLHIGLFVVILLTGVATSVRVFWTSSGIQRNQMRFILFGLLLGFLAIVASYLAFFGINLPAVIFPLFTAMSFSFAYAIFKHNLFEFDLWMRRLSIDVGVYVTLAGLPALAFFPFRNRLPVGDEHWWVILCGGVIAYGILFSLAPAITAYVRQKAEQRRWEKLHQQLDAVRQASERLSDETGVTFAEIPNRIIDVMREVYWDRMKNPPTFVFAAVMDRNENLAVAVHPPHAVDAPITKSFFSSLVRSKLDAGNRPFSAWDARQSGADDEVSLYLENNGVELCCPCVHDGKLHGVVLLGPKLKGIFEPEELTTLQMTASHVATAVRKSELLTYNKVLKELDIMKSELISNITHEFKSPLNAVENAIGILLNDAREGRGDYERTTKYLMMIRNNAQRLTKFIQGLLDIARIEKSKVDLRLIKTDLSKILHEAAELLRPVADQKGIELNVKLNGAIPIRVDEEKMNQVFTNLLSNAIKFTEQGKVELALMSTDGKIRVMVSDTGRGIEPRYLAEVFERFFQVPEEKYQSQGTGLGLAIAKGWVEAHGGRIWAESDGIGKGTTFIVELPE